MKERPASRQHVASFMKATSHMRLTVFLSSVLVVEEVKLDLIN